MTTNNTLQYIWTSLLALIGFNKDTPTKAQSVPETDFPTWKKLKYGGKSKEILLEELELRFGVSPELRRFINHEKFILTARETEIDLVEVEVREVEPVSEPYLASLGGISEGGISKGLFLLTYEMAIELFLQHGDQHPLDRYVFPAMESMWIEETGDAMGWPHFLRFIRNAEDGKGNIEVPRLGSRDKFVQRCHFIFGKPRK